MKDLSYIQSKLEEHLETFLPLEDFRNVLLYSTLPAGKLFRPQLVYALAHDLNEHSYNHEVFASSIEIHHAYTLVHDDLPAMDNDDFRRGKPSCHKQFNEWKAILCGDALMNISFGLLSQINHQNLAQLLGLYSEYTGPRGLILGQVMDLEDRTNSIDEIILIHTLKTSRLIQLSLEGSLLLTQSSIDIKIISDLGLKMGVAFQLLDDLSELTEEINKHELNINPFIHHDSTILINEINNALGIINTIFEKYKLVELERVMTNYLSKMESKIKLGHESIKNHIRDFSIDTIKF